MKKPTFMIPTRKADGTVKTIDELHAETMAAMNGDTTYHSDPGGKTE
jgi:hypothetical protein